MAASPKLLSSFDNALESFKLKSGLTPKDLQDMEVTTLLDLQKTIANIQKRQQGSKKMMYLKRLQPFLNAMEQYTQVINIFVNTSDIAAFVWGPMKYLLIVASNVSEAFNTLLEGYLSIGEQIPLLVQYRQLFESNQYMKTELARIFEDILEFHLEAVKLFRQRTWRQLYHATGWSLNKRIEEITNSLRRHKTIIEARAPLVQYEEFQASQQHMKDEFAKLQAAEKDRRYNRVQDWLGCTVNSIIRHQDSKRDRLGNTGQWILKNPRFEDWFSPSQCIDPLLWLHGMPGVGKTVLASLIVDKALKLPDTTTTYFYCRHTDGQKNGFLTIAKSIISQVLAKNDTILDYLYVEASGSGEAVLSTIALAKELLSVSLKTCKQAYIVLDGLDEYSRDDRKELVSWFRDLISKLPKTDHASLRCLFVSQEDGRARKDLSALSQIKITSFNNRADIETFCREWHQKIERKFGPLEKKGHHVTNIVSARAQGMFLYAKLVTWNLYEQTTRADFEAEMDPDKIPQGLDQAYGRIIQRLLGPEVSESRCKSILKLLGWIARAKRPLKWYEIQGAVSVDLDDGIISAQLRFREECKDLCASLVDITSDQTVTFVHTTLKQYLVSNDYIKIQQVEYDMATRCLVYLGMAEFQADKAKIEIEEAYFNGVYAFTDYAACQAVAAAKKWLHPSFEAPPDGNILQLPRVIAQIRTVLERMISSPSISKDTEKFILQHYGSNHYKCARLSCQFFHEGFISKTQRDIHIDKHDRSYSCVWQGCPYEFIGFATKKSLQKHVFDYHGIEAEPNDLEFPEKAVSTSQNQKRPATFACELCPKKFTRSFNLRAHLRGHSGGKPFPCIVCGKGFSRNSDRKRHEDLHKDEKRYACQGELKSQPDKSWGCGRRFARADALALHLRSDAGQACLRPLLMEEEVQKLLNLPQDSTSQLPALDDLARPSQPNSSVSLKNLLPPNVDLKKLQWELVDQSKTTAFSLPSEVLKELLAHEPNEPK